VDIGDHVREGQLLAEIDAPELDAQVSQGRAGVAQAQGTLAQQQAAQIQSETAARLAKLQLDRWAVLVNKGVLARQELDQKQADYDGAIATLESAKSVVHAAQSSVRGAEANLQRLIRLQGYKELRAPFTGVITTRNADIGALISITGSSQGTPTGPGSSSTGELFREAQIDVLRIMVNVPQGDAPSISIGQHADVRVDQYLGRLFSGTVTRTASSLDAATRTLLTEVRVVNRDHALLPGEYAQVRFDVVRAVSPLLIPGDSLISRPTGTMVAVMDSSNQAHFRNITIGRDYGTAIEVTSGLQAGEEVVVNPSDDVKEGVTLKPQLIRSPGQTPGSTGAQSAKRPTGPGASTAK
jgi:RND family efflux transporter MFP subunit